QMPAGLGQGSQHGIDHECDVVGIAGMVGSHKTIGCSGTAPEMAHHHDPATMMKIAGHALRVRAEAAAFQAMKDQECTCAGGLASVDRLEPVKINEVAVRRLGTLA